MEDKAEGMVIWAIAESVGRLVVERVQAFAGAIMQNPLTGDRQASGRRISQVTSVLTATEPIVTRLQRYQGFWPQRYCFVTTTTISRV